MSHIESFESGTRELLSICQERFRELREEGGSLEEIDAWDRVESLAEKMLLVLKEGAVEVKPPRMEN